MEASPVVDTSSEPDRGAVMLDGLSIGFGDASVVEDLSLTVAAGSVVALMGPSGTGKSSVLDCISGILTPRAGRIRVGSTDVTSLTQDQKADFRRASLGLIHQDHYLLPELSIIDNVALTLIFDGTARDEALERATTALALVGIESLAQRRCHEVSGGEAQRAAIARALVRPGLIATLADEPTASLDAANADIIGDLLVDAVRERGGAVIIATHDDRLAAKCDHVVDLTMAAAP